MAKRSSRKLTERERTKRRRQDRERLQAGRAGAFELGGLGALGPEPGDVSQLFGCYLEGAVSSAVATGLRALTTCHRRRLASGPASAWGPTVQNFAPGCLLDWWSIPGQLSCRNAGITSAAKRCMLDLAFGPLISTYPTPAACSACSLAMISWGGPKRAWASVAPALSA